ncbi:MAG TPA: replication-associated recombination protein A [Solirubrobacterales bacterium]|jgi:putative ATPase|nr:replication-associated recombination protein A [Solirubrobacterales bacterium]
MDQLFEATAQTGAPSGAQSEAQPLAARMRPRTVEDLVGQPHLIQPGSALYEALTGKAPHSMILYGPPGSGKTTIARLVAAAADAAFEEHSAVVVGRPEAVKAIAAARERLKTSGRRTIYFLDEIHRFNKAQQDALLPAVEDGTIILIGATTENPFFEVNSALLSRTRLYTLDVLTAADIRTLLDRALTEERGLAGSVNATDEALDFLADRAGGDARAALAALETAGETALATSPEGGAPTIDLARAEDALQQRAVLYDKGGDKHYDFASAFIKSMRSSDPDAALYYMAAMLEGGEDPKFIARRIVIFASEDVGNADPQALVVAMAAAQALEYVGLPEAQINLAQAVTYCALAPRSKASYLAIAAASEYVAKHGVAAPPSTVRDTHYPGARELGHGGYENSHKAPDQLTSQQMLPDEAKDARFYDPVDRGYEATMKARLEAARKRRSGDKPTDR